MAALSLSAARAPARVRPQVGARSSSLLGSKVCIPRTRVARSRGAVTTKAEIRTVDAEELEVAIQTRDRPMLIDFFATWCGPCVLLADELKKVDAEMGDQVTIVKIDSDENADLASALQIQGLPTLIFVSTDPNKPALRTEGALPAATIIEIIQTELMAPPEQAPQDQAPQDQAPPS